MGVRAVQRAGAVMRTSALIAGVAVSPAVAGAAYKGPAIPHELPARALTADTRTDRWIVGALGDVTPDARRLFDEAGARQLTAQAWQVRAGRVRALVTDLERIGQRAYSERDRVLRRASQFEPLSSGSAWARSAIVTDTRPTPSPTTAIGIVDDQVDPSHTDVNAQLRSLNGEPMTGPHGTMVASAAAGVQDGVGVRGVFAGAPIVSYGMPAAMTCGDAAAGVQALADAKVRVINLSFGNHTGCLAFFIAVQEAYGRGSLIVASAGNEFAEGNPVIYPAAWPHVLSVAALNAQLRPAYFSSSNLAIDVAAPGESVPVAVPVGFDTEDGTADGVTVADGTSFSSPMVAGAAAWLLSQRPELAIGQAADLLRRSATDVAPTGWDRDSGYGLVSVDAALAAPVPRDDPLEPNDGLPFIDGTLFGSPDPFVWRGYGRRTISASVDQVEDPVDVYRVSVPGRATFKIRLHPTFGDPDIRVYGGSAKKLSSAALVDKSTRGRGRTDVVYIVNRSGHTRKGYIEVESAGDQLDSGYRMELVRLRRR